MSISKISTDTGSPRRTCIAATLFRSAPPFYSKKFEQPR